MTKWKRVASGLGEQQFKQKDRRPVLALITAALAPDRTFDRQVQAAVAAMI